MNIWDAISAHADGIKHAMFFELKLCTGWEGSEQRLDAWSIPLWPSLGNSITAYEVKVSRSDFLRELKNPDKRKAGLARSNEFYFATTAKVVKSIDEIPEECGWMLFENGILKIMKEAPHRQIGAPDWAMVKAICRRAFDSEVIHLKRRLDAISTYDRDERNRSHHLVVDQIAEWLYEESKSGNFELAKKLKKILGPTGLYDWVKVDE